MVAVAIYLHWLWPEGWARAPYLAFYPAVVAAAGFCGAGPGIFATVLSVVSVNLWFDATPGVIDVWDPVVVARQVIFSTGGIGISIVAGMRRRAQQLRAQATEEASTLAELVQQGQMLVRDADDRIVRWSEGCARLYGFTAEQALGRPSLELLQTVLPASREEIAEALGSDKRWHGELRSRRADGSEVFVVSLWIARTVDGVPVVLQIDNDITQQKRVEEALRASEQRFGQMADLMPQMVWTTGPDGTVEYFNQRYYEITGADPFTTETEDWSVYLHPEDRRRSLEAWTEALRTGQPYQIEFRVKVPGTTNEYRWYLARALPLRDSARKIIRWYGTCTDIHEAKTQREELAAAKQVAEQSKAAMEEASRAKDRFLAVLSHELRTPLTPVLANLSLLQDEASFPDEFRDDLEMIRRNVELEARLIDDLLDVTRIVRGKLELDRRPVELCTIILGAVEVCQPDLESRRLHFGLNLGPEAPYVINADAGRLQQVFWNVLKNAIKFTPHGGCVGISCVKEREHVVVEVQDSGQGIDPAVLPRVFNPFEQGGAQTTRRFGGLGLGLMISRGIVEMHGGNIEASSEGPGKGTTFRIRLPILGRTEAAALGSDRPAPSIQDVARLRILLVEDHADTAHVMARVLRGHGHVVEVAMEMAEALADADLRRFDLLVSDLGLPDGSGIELLKELRRRQHFLPAIALSGYGQEEDLRRSMEAGFDAHLIKPVSASRLAETIATVAKAHGLPRAQQ